MLRNPVTIQQQRILNLIATGEHAKAIAETVGCKRSAIYRTAIQFGVTVAVDPRPPHARDTGLLKVTSRLVKYKNGGCGKLYQSAHIPLTALRRAGLDKDTQLKFTASEGRIVVEKNK